MMSMQADFPDEFDYTPTPIHKTLDIHLQELRQQIAHDIENAVIEVVGDSAHTLQQAANIARGK